jgi:hypothetical protein
MEEDKRFVGQTPNRTYRLEGHQVLFHGAVSPLLLAGRSKPKNCVDIAISSVCCCRYEFVNWKVIDCHY